MDGYNLDQLLTWTLEDDVIDSFSFLVDGRIEIRHEGATDIFDRTEAELLLRRLIGRINGTKRK